MQRYWKIITLFLAFAFQYWWLDKTKGFYSEEQLQAKYKALYRRQARTYANTAVELGGLLIKLGQFLSSRVDILPAEYVEELAKLQDQVKPVASHIILARVEAELGHLGEHFRTFAEQPLAAASLGQVHLAQLNTGEQVAVKVLRPGIEEIIAIDIKALQVVVKRAKRNKRLANAMDLEMLYQEFASIVVDELDYEQEGESADRFRVNCAADPMIKIPQIHWDLTTKKVLTMEYVEGTKISEAKVEGIAERFFASYLEQVMVHGFFHADPHPGNVLVGADGSLIYLDFGMVGTVDPEMKENLLELAVNIFKKDANGIVSAFDSLGFLRSHADQGTLVKMIKVLLQEGPRDFGNLTADIRALMYSQPFQLPAGTLFLGKALVTITGICNGLNKEFDSIKAATPFLQTVMQESGVGVWDQVKKTLQEVVFLPDKITKFIDGVEAGEIRLQPARSFENLLLEQQAKSSRQIIAAILCSGFVLAGSILIHAGFASFGLGLMGLGGLALLGLVPRAGRQRARHMRVGTGFKRPRFHS